MVDCYISDYDFSQGKLKSSCNYVSSFVLLSRSARRPPKNWFKVIKDVSHVNCGGVTDGIWKLFVYHRQESVCLDVQPQVTRDLSSCLDSLLHKGVPCLMPRNVAPNTLAVHEVRPGLICSDDLFTWKQQTVSVICSNVFSPTKWVKWKLTYFDLAKVLDIPMDIWENLPVNFQHQVSQDLTLLLSKVTVRLPN
jgi:hypothetical protein